MTITKKELWQIARDRAQKEIKFKETIWDTLYLNAMFFDVTILFLALVISSGFFPDIFGWVMGIAVGVVMISLIPMVISLFIFERHSNAYSDKVARKTKEIFKSLEGDK
jgi:intracellular septation protein A